MAALYRYFKKQSLPTSNEAELQYAIIREVNNSVENILVEERERKYTHFTPEARARITKIYVAQCGNAAAVKEALCQGVSNSRREYIVLV